MMFDKTNYSKYKDSLDELEKACINETLVNEEYYKNLEKEFKEGLMNDSSFVHVTLDSHDEILKVISFGEIRPIALKTVCINHGLKCISKSKTLNIDLNSPFYTYLFISNKKSFISGVLCKNLTETSDNHIIYNLLDSNKFKK